jgi:hypothetical protein
MQTASAVSARCAGLSLALTGVSAAKDLTFFNITPDPARGCKPAVDGSAWGVKILNAKVAVLNSRYDTIAKLLSYSTEAFL